MATLKFTDCRIENHISDGGGIWIALLLDRKDVQQARQFVAHRMNKIYSADLREYRDRRSLDANACYWELCGKLARAMGEKPETIYRRHIKDIGNYDTICIQEKALNDFTRRWTSNHIGRFVETRESKLPGCVTVLAYYGSSDFDRAEMSRLIDNCIQDCQAVGIETLPPDKVDLLKEAWNA